MQIRLNGATFKACVTKYTDPNSIFVTSHIKYGDLIRLQDEIQEYCKSVKNKYIDNIEENKPCLALCPEDSRWYRGLVSIHSPVYPRSYLS